MGCMVSSQRKEKGSPPECSGDSGNLIYRVPSRRSDPGEKRMVPPKNGSGKVPEMSSPSTYEKAAEVLTALGGSLPSFKIGKVFVSGNTSRVNKISILAFEVANTIAKGATLMKSLSKENIQLLKEEVLYSEGIRQLVSTDFRELQSIAAADKRNEVDAFSVEVIRFGNLCKDPVWHNLGRYFQTRHMQPAEQLKDDAETAMHQLMNLAQITSELYHELNSLDRFKHDYRQKFQEEESLPAGRDVKMILHRELEHQEKTIKILKKKSLWSRGLEEVVEKLVDIVVFLQNAIVEAFGTNGSKMLDNTSVQSPKLGASGLALHYANIINQIDNIVSRPLTLPPNMRDALYQGLPAGIKASLRSRLQLFHAKEEYTVAHIKGEMQKTLRWIVPLAENTIRVHQGFGWVGEWANLRTELSKKPSSPHHSLIRIQTLFHADKKETEKCILELVVLLHHLVVQVKNRGYGFKAQKPIRIGSQGATSSFEISRQESSHVNNGERGNALQISREERELLENASSQSPVLGRSESAEIVRSSEWRGKNGGKVSRSCNTSPTRELSEVFSLHLKRTNVLDVLDGLDTLPSVSFYA